MLSVFNSATGFIDSHLWAKGAEGGEELAAAVVEVVDKSCDFKHLYPLLGEMTTMPGLPSHPAGERIDIDGDGNVVGLS